MTLLDRLRDLVTGGREEGEPDDWIFASDVLSAVTLDECAELAALAAGRRVLEIGSYHGRSTIAAASVAEVVHSVDPHRGGPPDSPDTLDVFVANLERYGVRDRVVVHVGTSTAIVPELREEQFDVVFIDAMHQRPDVDVDFALAAVLLAPAGVAVFHDYGVEGVEANGLWHPFEVTAMVDELTRSDGAVLAKVVDSLAVVRLDAKAGSTWRSVVAARPDPQTIRPTPTPFPMHT